MREFWFIFVYGALTFVGAFLAPFWASRARLRRKEVEGAPKALLHDSYYVVTFSVTVIAVGLLLVDVGRLWGNLEFGLSPMLRRPEGYLIGTGLGVMLIGFMGLVWLADLEKRPVKATWTKVGAVITSLWALASIYLASNLPITGF